MSNTDHRPDRRAVIGGAVAGVTWAGLTPVWASAHELASGPISQSALNAVAARLDRDLIELRRDIHRHPETAGQERRTSELVAGRLRAAGLDVTTGVGGYGVVAVLHGSRRGRTIAYRADMDAVPPDGQINGGAVAAHLCGHDLHIAIGVGAAQVLARLRAQLAGSVVFVFQPAEESLTGAAAMLADGVFSQVRPAEIHALHCGPLPVGRFLVTPGYGLPGQDRGTVTLAGADASTRAARLAGEIGAIGTVPRPATSEDLERLVTALQTPSSPLSTFVFMQAQAVGAVVRLSYRCWPPNRYTEIRADVEHLARSEGAAADFPATPFPALVCSERDGHAIEGHLQRALGGDHVAAIEAAIPYSGEDFALFLDRYPGTYTFLGVRAPGAAVETSYPHFGAFDPDERAVGYGVRAMAGWLAARAGVTR
ncbi:M20 family metallopeptidase [Parafrankia sp. EUN1f]|uniref:M20 metallopeptidase family protein n=1 Tax=Parafrankia sp. EUN1f TaxID=102897 RepID=UPI000563FDAA|nr:M20/M25/M40 family metallo-hydrolase [Parafrankia sp. EUN1f]